MNSIAIDFKNHCVCIMKDNQHRTEINLSIGDKIKYASMFPSQELMDSSSSFTWSFEDNLFAVNEEYNLPDNPDAIMTEDCFIPVKIVTFPGLSDKYEEMKSLMGYEDVKWTEDDFKDFPDEIKDLFRHLFE